MYLRLGADIECVLALTSGEALAANTHFLRSLETTSAIVSTHFVTGQQDITGWTGKSRLTDARVVLTGCKIRARDFINKNHNVIKCLMAYYFIHSKSIQMFATKGEFKNIENIRSDTYQNHRLLQTLC